MCPRLRGRDGGPVSDPRAPGRPGRREKPFPRTGSGGGERGAFPFPKRVILGDGFPDALLPRTRNTDLAQLPPLTLDQVQRRMEFARRAQRQLGLPHVPARSERVPRRTHRVEASCARRERTLRSRAESFARRNGLFMACTLLLYKTHRQVKPNRTMRICSLSLEGLAGAWNQLVGFAKKSWLRNCCHRAIPRVSRRYPSSSEYFPGG